LKKSALLVVDCAVSGQTADRIASPTAPYWNTVAAPAQRGIVDPAATSGLDQEAD
jgi:hypothetical protein